MVESDKEIDFLEEQIPYLAAAAVEVAYWRALASGQRVLIADDEGICEMHADGTRILLQKTERRQRVAAGTRIRIA